MIDKIPFLRTIIGPYKEKQFTPADPLVVVGLINKNLIKNAVPATIKIDVNDKDKNKGFRVYVTTNASSKTTIVDSIDTAVFEEEILASFSTLGKQRII
jgi:purine nucleoside permease